MYHYIITADGGALNNGTPQSFGYGSFHIVHPEFPPGNLFKLTFGEGVTNNQAEYLTLIESLKKIKEIGAGWGSSPKELRLFIRIDSALVLGQLTMGWKVKNPRLLQLVAEASNLLQEFERADLKKISGDEMKSILGH